MNTNELIQEYINIQPEPKRSDLQELNRIILEMMPNCRVWFLDGKDEKGKIVTNPNIGYGLQTLKYADGKSREFYQIGVSANKSGISVYIMGISDKTYLSRTFGQDIGKASVTGYCIKFKKLIDISIETLVSAIQYGIADTNG
ncbi:MAG: DUF1801 domain-containing protein [Deferribacteres bacterium]|nr:DUF1801 domain-containing protein [candidate division KSB1 bacterium]MCB9503269.1 DUF1801 domain-containing protein [Deferribacteres bacterium]